MALSGKAARALEVVCGDRDAAQELVTALDLATSTNTSQAATLTAAANEIAAITGKPASVSISVGTEADDVREIAVTVLDENGDALTSTPVHLRVYVFADAAAAALATTGGSTGIALGTGGNGILAVTVTAKKVFDFVTEPNGVLDLKWTDNATEAAYLGVALGGKIYMSTALTNAA